MRELCGDEPAGSLRGHFRRYKLSGRESVRVDDLLEWAEWFEGADRRIARSGDPEGTEVSTVFLGVDHQFGKGPPLLFETMTFGGPFDGEQDRSATWSAAEAAHEDACRVAGVVL